MKKIFSLLLLCLCGMAFVSCESDEPVASKSKFKSCLFRAEPEFSEDILNMYDITMTYTAMDGSVKEIKPDQNGKISVTDEYSDLPATVKYEVKAVKKATYKEYLASKPAHNLKMRVPGAYAHWMTTDGKETIARDKKDVYGLDGILAEKVNDYLTTHDKYLNFTFEGTYTKTENGCAFNIK